MTLEVISSGFGRTGTKSMKEALEVLGFSPCHHMYEVFDHPEQVKTWQAVAAGRPVDWKTAFSGYRAQVDWPGAHVWRELFDAFPDVKVVHTMRPEEKWWASFERTIARLMGCYKDIPLPPHILDMMEASDVIIGQHTFGGQMLSKDHAIAAFRKRHDDVVSAIPPDQLLVFDVAEGWDPLCAFLGKDVPDEPFPHHNLRADFWEALGGEPT
jgi:hypothetical protein